MGRPVTAAALVADLRRRGIRLEAAGDRLRYAPKDALSPADVEALRAVKADVLRLLTDPDVDDVAAPGGPCGLCWSPLAYVEGWPTAGEARWLCPSCAAQPAPSMVAVLAGLAASGDSLAVALRAVNDADQEDAA